MMASTIPSIEEEVITLLEKHGMLKRTSLRSMLTQYDIQSVNQAIFNLESQEKIQYKITDHSKFSGYILKKSDLEKQIDEGLDAFDRRPWK